MHDHPRQGAPARPPRRRPRLSALVAVLALTLAVAACTGGGDKGNGVASLGGGSATSTNSTGGRQDDRQQALDWARCLRQHGVDMPDPRFDAQGHMLPPEPAAVPNAQAKLKFKAAEQACKQYEPSGGSPLHPPGAQERQQVLAFARCLRQHGLNVPDPQIDATGIHLLPEGMDEDDPRLRAPRQACRQYLPN